MPHYRCYCLDAGDKIIAVAAAMHQDHTAAILWAETLLSIGEHKNCSGIELWCDARLVHRKRKVADS
jgi:hypothetical protein